MAVQSRGAEVFAIEGIEVKDGLVTKELIWLRSGF